VVKPIVKQVIGAGLRWPYGDRRQSAQSGDAERNPAAVRFELNQEIIAKLIHAN
jgi:hypothetical protein